MYEVQELTASELEVMLKNNVRTHIIDVREYEEVAQGMIPSAKHIPLQQIPDSLNYFHKDQEYIIVCRAGVRSMNACLYLAQHGFTATNLAGGMLDWNGEVI
ncbi:MULTISPECIES: rhodanese-like domain-containing protein [Pontibacillus]|uniref:Rhodanese-like domain-containing protein n=1 Tax=Pontibacillus chungwhensis TaxID=265426 RepID=A0ABY8UX22_9BACI|nr:rhodanese-like domain-containing protein [Pontibacillus chungwhensis]MCD5325034.1 rhodanese-like domain-containing protein [Pontibacillus sp. HN14]WIF97291.1 rhodanese-like domain-containing protein [Pontibacillus chungwhensis]